MLKSINKTNDKGENLWVVLHVQFFLTPRYYKKIFSTKKKQQILTSQKHETYINK